MKANNILRHISKSTTRKLRYSLLYGTDEATSRKLGTKEMFQNWRQSSGEPQDGPGHGAHNAQEETARTRYIQLENEKAKGGSNSYLLLPHGEVVNTQ